MLAFAPPTPDATPIWLVSAENWPAVKSTIGAAAAAFAEHCGFQPKAGRMQLLPGEGGALAGVLFGIDEASAPARDPFGPGKLATSLPEGVYRFANMAQDADLAALGFLLALYRYDRFKADKSPRPRLAPPDEVDAIRIQRIAQALSPLGATSLNSSANSARPKTAVRKDHEISSTIADAFDVFLRSHIRGKTGHKAIILSPYPRECGSRGSRKPPSS